MKMELPILLSILLLLTPTTTAVFDNKKILLSKVKTLTLRSNSQTAHRRVPSVPQLKCLTPRICKHYEVDIMRCTNQGSDYSPEDIQWSCTANMPEDFKLGSTDVICEGYSSADDPYVLKGSCGVEYRLALTDKGERKYGGIGNDSGGDSSPLFKAVFLIIFFAVAAWICHGIWQGLQRNRAGEGIGGNGRGGGGGGGGGGWGPGWGGGGDNTDDPPPPYSKYGSTGEARRPGEAWRPGFGTGLGAGALGGYAAGQFMGSRSNRSNSGSSWGSRRSAGTPSPPASSINHSSTGFGSTSRR